MHESMAHNAIKKIFLGLLFLTLAACGSGSGGDSAGDGGGGYSPASHKATPAEGKIAGAPWQFISGVVRPGFTPDTFFFVLYSENAPNDPCWSLNYTTDRKMVFSTPNKVGDVILGQSPNIETVTFAYQDNGVSQNMAATTGSVRVNEVNTNYVSGSLNAKFDDNNVMNGTFQAKVCP